MNCPDFYPTDQRQLVYKWGGKYGGANCTACAAGEAGEAQTCGSLLYTGAQVRAASNEPIPDPSSPGLNLPQVDAALYKLSNGRIDLDTHQGYDTSAAEVRIVGGAQAIVQIQRSVLIKHGLGFGNSFPGGHAIETGMSSTGLWFLDPLTGRHAITFAVLWEAAAALVVSKSGEIAGRGKCYIAFTRDLVPDYRVSVQPFKGETRRSFALYTVSGTHIVPADGHNGRQVRSTGGFSANCRPPRLYQWSGHSSQRLVIITSGFLAKEAASKHLTYAIPEKYARALP